MRKTVVLTSFKVGIAAAISQPRISGPFDCVFARQFAFAWHPACKKERNRYNGLARDDFMYNVRACVCIQTKTNLYKRIKCKLKIDFVRK